MNPKTKVFLFGKQIRTAAGRFDSFKAAVKRAVRKTLQATAVVAVLALAFAIGGAFYSTSTITVSASTVEAPSPIMDRIYSCESGNGTPGSATQTKNGQVLVHVNSNGTYDTGIAQINSTWNKKAAELGYNLSVEADNKAFAKWLYANIGTSPWSSSQACWSR